MAADVRLHENTLEAGARFGHKTSRWQLKWRRLFTLSGVVASLLT